MITAKLTSDAVGQEIDGSGRLLNAFSAATPTTSPKDTKPPKPAQLNLAPIRSAIAATSASQLRSAIQSRIESGREIEEQQRQTALLGRLDQKLADILTATNETARNTGRRVKALVGP